MLWIEDLIHTSATRTTHQYETNFLRSWHFHTGTREQLSLTPSYSKHKSHLLILAHSSVNMGTDPKNVFLRASEWKRNARWMLLSSSLHDNEAKEELLLEKILLEVF